MSRYHPLENRLVETFRYVECDAANSFTFSYEYGNILRDIGSAFASVLDNLIRNSQNESSEKLYNMSNYRAWLVNELDDLHLITVGINNPRQDRYIMPFSSWKNFGSKLAWWDSYNNVKHSDIERYSEGNFRNCVTSLGALAIIYTLIDSESRNGNRIRLFDEIGFIEPEDAHESLLFFKKS